MEELVVNDDPEYQWIDKIRTPRSSNEARQRLFTKLTGIMLEKSPLIYQPHELKKKFCSYDQHERGFITFLPG